MSSYVAPPAWGITCRPLRGTSLESGLPALSHRTVTALLLRSRPVGPQSEPSPSLCPAAAAPAPRTPGRLMPARVRPMIPATRRAVPKALNRLPSSVRGVLMSGDLEGAHHGRGQDRAAARVGDGQRGLALRRLGQGEYRDAVGQRLALRGCAF